MVILNICWQLMPSASRKRWKSERNDPIPDYFLPTANTLPFGIVVLTDVSSRLAFLNRLAMLSLLRSARIENTPAAMSRARGSSFQRIASNTVRVSPIYRPDKPGLASRYAPGAVKPAF